MTELVERIRLHVGHDQVPYVDPTLGGVRAKVLFLLETPARAAAPRSAMLSPNNDATAANVWQLYRKPRLHRDATINWTRRPGHVEFDALVSAAGLPYSAWRRTLLSS